MIKNRKHSRQRGAALVIGLILLTVITLLAVVGMNISNSELAAATSEQVRLRAFQAAETAVEYAMQADNPTKNDVFDTPTKCGALKITPVTDIGGSSKNAATGAATDKYTSRISYVNKSQVTDGYSSGFASFHFTIETVGSSSRNSVAKHKMGAFIVNGTGGQDSFTNVGTACYVPLPSSW